MAGNGITRKELLQEWEKFKKDTNNQAKVQEMELQLFAPELIIELFVADFKSKSKLAALGYYTRFTPYARILHVGELCEGAYKELVPGDIVQVSAMTMCQVPNPGFAQWEAHQQHPNAVKTDAPVKFIRKIGTWFHEGYYFPVDVLDAVLNDTFVAFNAAWFENFAGPYVFKVPQYEVQAKPGKPWGFLGT